MSKRIYGKTLDVYLCILTSTHGIGVRDIWRELGFSSPSLAQYHVNKLMDLRLITNNENGKYKVSEGKSIEALRSFLLLRGLLIPRLTIYVGLLAGILGSYLLLYPWRGDFRDLTVLSVILFSIIAFSFEALKQYRGLKISLRDI